MSSSPFLGWEEAVHLSFSGLGGGWAEGQSLQPFGPPSLTEAQATQDGKLRLQTLTPVTCGEKLAPGSDANSLPGDNICHFQRRPEK